MIATTLILLALYAQYIYIKEKKLKTQLDMENTLIDIKTNKKFIALSNGTVIDTNEIIYLSQISQYGQEGDYKYYMTIIFNNHPYSHTMDYSSVDDAEEDYWIIRHALLDENESDMICE